MERKTIVVVILALALVTALFQFLPLMAKAPLATTFSVDPSSWIDPSLMPGSSFSVDVNVMDAVDLFGWQVVMVWDAPLLEVTNVVFGDFLAGQPEGSVTAGSIQNDDGYFVVGESTKGPYPGVNGDGWLCSIVFSVEAIGETALDISSGYMGLRTYYIDSLIDEVEVNKEDGYFNNLGGVIVYVDIKPGSWPNPIKTKRKGVLPVCICGTEDFDVMTIDPASLSLQSQDVEGGVVPLRWSWEDVATPYVGEPGGGHDLEGDGYLDLVLLFDAQEAAMTLTITEHLGETLTLVLRGNLLEEYDGAPIQGEDYVWAL